MAGRGRRCGGYGESGGPLRRPGEAAVPSLHSADINIQALIKKITEICVTNVDPILLHEIEVLFKQLCMTRESVKDVLLNLHCKALSDVTFGEKLVHALEPVLTLEIDNTCVRSELLTFIQSDFKTKDTMCQSDSKKFLNAVMFLGGVYKFIKIQGVPIMVLGMALLEYMDLLLLGDEEQLRVLTTQIFLNGGLISKTESLASKYDLLKQSLRKALVEKNLTEKARCWILLALDLMSNDLKLPNGIIRDFYVNKMGDEYLGLESTTGISNLAERKSPQKSVLFPESEVVKSPPTPTKKFNFKQVSPPKNDDVLRRVEYLSIDHGRKFEPKEPRNPLSRSFREPKSGRNPASSRIKRWEMQRQKIGKHELTIENNSEPPHENSIGEDDFYGIQIEKEKVVGATKGVQQRRREKSAEAESPDKKS